MNKLINEKSFTESFKSASVDKTIGSTFLAKNLVMAMSVMVASSFADKAMANNLEIDNLSPPTVISNTINYYSQYIDSNDDLREITHENFNDIVNGQISGVYKHPFIDDEVIALAFTNDPDANNRIKADLNVLFEDDANYGFSKLLDDNADFYLQTDSKVAAGVNASRHIQDPFEMGLDINYTVMDTENSFLPEDVVDIRPEYEEYQNYFIYIHELGHSLEHQQMGLVDFAESLFDKEDLIMMENSSDFTAAVLTAQYMHKSGENVEQINEFLMEISRERLDNLPGFFSSDVIQYATSPSIYVSMDMINNNPEIMLNMDLDKIEDVSEVVSQMSVENNYKPDLVTGILAKAGLDNTREKLLEEIQEMGALMEKDPNKFNQLYAELETSINEVEDAEQKKYLEGILELLDAVKDGKDIGKSIDNMLVNSYNLEQNIDLNNIDSQKELSKANVLAYPDFADSVMDKLKEDGIFDPAVIAEENGISTDQVVDIANLNATRLDQGNNSTIDADMVADIARNKQRNNDYDFSM